ncbi:allantoate deiminase [Peptoclostridium litorale DSM 5388]|uniref:Allantoate amidohydrolase AllC n=1 Tax=Peptoclostridium litorale DSM 5388 TaxID=1121324 RepID=A0A069RQ44_PEPLI|nr:allantoate deiminase [Peptoclostridium litorale]KDR96302.1 allantoate amidohydrolase AllC [Peptoclostridium litorale DSM 5388]SIO26014.1 allantoate deiminase [Peptoclostridium litorale DSM 5388]
MKFDKKDNLGRKATELLNEVSAFGELDEGGMSRLLYTPEWLGAQNFLKEYMDNKGFTTYFDNVGNLYGKIEGTNCSDKTVLTGSHVDSVKNGGILDGQFGIIAGIIAINYLYEKYGSPIRTLEVVSFAEEEGSRFPYTFWGSKNIFGIANRNDVIGIHDENMVPFSEAMKKCGFNFKSNDSLRRNDIKVFVELHVEQGNVLELEEKNIGVVTAVVGQRRFSIKVVGQANHAGTTPLKYRKDAMSVSSKIINRINDMAWDYGEPLVATVGRVELTPNIVNVVPGEVEFTLDVRHPQGDVIKEFTQDIKKMIEEEGIRAGVDTNIDMWMDEDPVYMDSRMVDIIEEKCKDNSVEYKVMHSGAGHDAQIVAQFVPTGMIFVPSKNGISHSPDEFTYEADLERGIKILIETLYELAYKETFK